LGEPQQPCRIYFYELLGKTEITKKILVWLVGNILDTVQKLEKIGGLSFYDNAAWYDVFRVNKAKSRSISPTSIPTGR